MRRQGLLYLVAGFVDHDPTAEVIMRWGDHLLSEMLVGYTTVRFKGQQIQHRGSTQAASFYPLPRPSRLGKHPGLDQPSQVTHLMDCRRSAVGVSVWSGS